MKMLLKEAPQMLGRETFISRNLTDFPSVSQVRYVGKIGCNVRLIGLRLGPGLVVALGLENKQSS